MALHMNVDPWAPDDRALVLAAEVLQAGGVVVYPTETVYGLGASAWNPDAVRRIQIIKRRQENKPILVLVHAEEAVFGLAAEVTDAGRALMRAFWPGPLTLVFTAAPHVPAELTLGLGTIGVRIPDHPLCRRLAALCGYPITSTSANVSGTPVPSTIAAIESELGPGVDLYLDAGLLPTVLPSTVVDVSGPRPILVREGVLTFHQLTAIVPDIIR